MALCHQRGSPTQQKTSNADFSAVIVCSALIDIPVTHHHGNIAIIILTLQNDDRSSEPPLKQTLNSAFQVSVLYLWYMFRPVSMKRQNTSADLIHAKLGKRYLHVFFFFFICINLTALLSISSGVPQFLIPCQLQDCKRNVQRDESWTRCTDRDDERSGRQWSKRSAGHCWECWQQWRRTQWRGKNQAWRS